jgi:L-ascorbate metabolism protein UlaG (beta-lactamase superfamily)
VQLVKYGHACVTLVADGRRLVLDPGVFTPEDALAGADGVLVTHEHPDHFDERRLRAALAADPGLRLWTNQAVAARLDGLAHRITVVGHGDRFAAAGFEVEAHGQWHAEVHRDIPRIPNVGFLLDGRVFHPGDALTVPDRPVDTLLLPVHAPWSRTADLIDWVREVAPARTLAVHDGALNDIGLGLVGGLLGERGPGTGAAYTRLTPGTSVALD